MEDIIVTGDIHGNWGALNQLISRRKPKLILQTGDFGWWPRLNGLPKPRTKRNSFGRWIKPWNAFGIKCQGTKIYFCPGNHEDWEELLLRVSEPAHLYDEVYYMQRGAIAELPDGRIVLFMGGGLSIDRDSRTMGIDWFPQELIPYAEFYKLQEAGVDKIDIVISHTCPSEFNAGVDVQLRKKPDYAGRSYKYQDCSQQVLSAILEEYKPSLWYFGHFHLTAEGVHDTTKWYCLNYPENGGRWWRYLEDA
jgi:hypothetical protein